jgi:membrane peptidoglycan carboxypeptidase
MASEREPGGLRRSATLVGHAVIAGLILAVAALPATALAGVVTRRALMPWDALPVELRTPRVPQASVVYAADGRTLLTTFYDENRQDVTLARVAPVMRQAMVAAEDTRFYRHGGVDLRSVARALVNDAGGGNVQGASTLTMQYVRNVLKEDPRLSPAQRAAATAETFGRKVQEARYAMALEQRLTKDQILERYLNIAYFGAGAYGIAEAARTYFGEPAGALTLPQAAMLAGLMRAPDADSPLGGDRRAALARRGYVLDAMLRAHDISAAQARAARAAPLGLDPHAPHNGCLQATHAGSGWGFFCDYLRRWWDTQPQFGATPAARDAALLTGGYTIVTSLDPAVQAAATRQALAVYGYESPRALPTAVVQPGTGRVLALAVNRHYSLAPNPRGRPTWPNTVDPLITGGGPVTGYQTGSTFKLFTMLAALSAGMPLDTRFRAPARLVTRWPASGPGSCRGRYCPVNESPSWMDGERTMWTAFGRSVNTYFVWLEEQVGPRQAVAMARRLGITFPAAADSAMATRGVDGWGSFTLGVSDTTPLELAAAYATVAADGRYCRPVPVASIVDGSGRRVDTRPACTQAVAPDVARAAADAARCPVGQQSAYGRCDGGTAAIVPRILGDRPVLGKTGSAENNATETFVAATPQVAVAAVAADPADPTDAVGAGVASQVDAAVAQVLAVASAGLPYRDFAAPGLALAFGIRPTRG